ncbi:ABC transporter ATP-binding protein [Saccharibacillus kuerlensis]|uniref:ABC transporter ATP-binding protein n=1 Tax=Saccharibacillus kuerlensis TaxID=459527 RepID=A0ABQ2L1I7_9BACL|nr:ABC transporter ATP-binding protein [Saccharibacillus kuerlensis]GGN99629.1 ABC transporter ATP-binding protein [Saccharibacillus kuerlensis]
MIGIENIKMSFGNRLVLDQVGLLIQKGRPHALLGKNGAGKTTLIKIILGLLRQQNGTVDFPTPHMTIGYLPEERGMYKDIRVDQAIRYFGKLGSRQPKDYQAYLEKFELLAYEKLHVRSLSKGNQQKLQLAVALVNSPEFLILDEPFSGLDPLNRELFSDIISDYAKEHYLLISSHQLDKIEVLGQDISFLKAGKIIASGTLEQIRKTYGFKQLYLPESIEVENVFSNYHSFEKEKGRYRIPINEDKDFWEMMKQIEGRDISFVSFQNSSLEDIYIRLMK